MRIPLALLQARFDNPKGFKAALLKYLAENGYKVDREKTIAEIAWFDQRVCTAGTPIGFFTGQPTANSSNLTNFVRPEAEHQIITHLKIHTGNAINVQDTAWLTGANTAQTRNGQISITTNGVTVLAKMPILQAPIGLTTDDAAVIGLAEPIVWAAQTDIAVNTAVSYTHLTLPTSDLV